MDLSWDDVGIDPATNNQPHGPTWEDVGIDQQPSVVANTLTGLARGFGQLMGPAGQAELLVQREAAGPSVPQTSTADIAKAATNAALMGNKPYEPQTPLGRGYQNVVTNAVAGAPFAAIGPGGLLGFGARQLGNLTGSIGGEVGENTMPNHPIIGRLLGTLLGAAGGTGMFPSPRSAAPTMPTVSQSEQILADQGGNYWTPGRVAAASDLNKQQAAAKILGVAPQVEAEQSPGLLSRMFSAVETMLPKDQQFIPKLIAGEAGLAGLGHLLDPSGMWNFATSHPGLLGALAAGIPTARGLTTQLPQTGMAASSGLFPYMMNQPASSGPF